MTVVIVLKVLWMCMWLFVYVALALLALGAVGSVLYFALIGPPLLVLHAASWTMRGLGKVLTSLFSDVTDQTKRRSAEASDSDYHDNFRQEASRAEAIVDSYSILGLQPGVSLDEITKAYRQKMLKNHPDKVATLDPALQKLATQRTQAISEAYNEILGRL